MFERFPREAILAFSVEGFSATNFLSGYEAVQFIPLFTLTLRRRLVCAFMPSGVIFALAPSSSLGVQFESGLYLVCLGNFFGRVGVPQRTASWPARPRCARGCPLSAPSAPAVAATGYWCQLGLTCLLSARSSVFSVNVLEFTFPTRLNHLESVLTF